MKKRKRAERIKRNWGLVMCSARARHLLEHGHISPQERHIWSALLILLEDTGLHFEQVSLRAKEAAKQR
jgi:hypothetical protein